jgi:Zn-dependent peptidase ImmA (M78 family)
MELDKKRIGYCRDMARKILQETNSIEVPISVEKILGQYGFRVVYLDQPPEQFSGILHRGKKAIGINKHHHQFRQRFSIAHELGHYFLDHPDAEEEIPDDENSTAFEIYEKEADEFAGELLVPKDQLKQAFNQTPDIDSLRKKFQVSQHVIIIQISKYGLLMKI